MDIGPTCIEISTAQKDVVLSSKVAAIFDRIPLWGEYGHLAPPIPHGGFRTQKWPPQWMGGRLLPTLDEYHLLHLLPTLPHKNTMETWFS